MYKKVCMLQCTVFTSSCRSCSKNVAVSILQQTIAMYRNSDAKAFDTDAQRSSF